jgi:hypothetical protein
MLLNILREDILGSIGDRHNSLYGEQVMPGFTGYKFKQVWLAKILFHSFSAGEGFVKPNEVLPDGRIGKRWRMWWVTGAPCWVGTGQHAVLAL